MEVPENMDAKEEEHDAMLLGQADVWKFMLSFADSMALKCAVELGVADIIDRHGGPITLKQIMAGISDAPSPDITYLARIMRFLVRKKIFTANQPLEGTGESETLYGLTHSSRWILRDSKMSLAPMLLMENHPWLMAPWHCFSQCVREGGVAFKKAHGCELWELASEKPEFNTLFNEGLASTSRIVHRAMISEYKDGFASIGTLVDVGGGTGSMVDEIVKSYPHIRGINFDLPHVISTAPHYDGVTHVGGDMFKAVPNADVVLLKWVLHDWSDEDCIKILKNCKKALPEKKGKLMIVECVVQPDGKGPFDESKLVFDLLMIAHTVGKERTEAEWKKLLAQAGYPRYRILDIQALPSIIEAYPI